MAKVNDTPAIRYEDVPDDLLRRIKAEAITDLFTRLRAQGFVLRREP